ncbi:MarR family winged helix-turn-helix transcriptional regulator [Massilia niastensis]|uniref:MarR family winged helix-turn-helix transcriptional regulator n=1 Tax=Massilia niastensis TaxID=544911 RepID=UPI0004768D70|nr:MarR family transcriptional regulator [Massilia niastensis]
MTKGRIPAGERLDDFLCFAIYSANLSFGRAFKPKLSQLGLTYPQYIAIVALYEEDDVSVCRLGEKLFLESNTLTPVLKKLEAMGHVVRERDRLDERQVRIRLTEQGRRLRVRAYGLGMSPASGMRRAQVAATHACVVALRGTLVGLKEK